MDAGTGRPDLLNRLRRRQHLYVGCGDGKVYCLDVSSGKTVWSTPTGNGIDSSPAVIGDTVLIGSEDFYFYALDANTGAVRWKYETGLGISSSPAATKMSRW